MRQAATILALTACATEVPVERPGACEELGAHALRTADRAIVGMAAPWSADGTLRAREEALVGSMSLRREMAWETVQKVIEPVALDLPAMDAARLPAWQTWYHRDDLQRIFQRLHAALSPEQRASRTRFSPEALDEAFFWNADAIDDDSTWPEDRFSAYLASLDSAEEVAGVGGISRVAYNTAAARHLLQSYPEILACREGLPAPEPPVVVPVTRQGIQVPACSQELVGTFAVAEEEWLHVSVEDDGEATVLVVSEAGGCTTDASAQPCSVVGPATVDVVVAADVADVRAVVEVTREPRDEVPWSPCLDGPFPHDAALLKTDFRRADFELPFPVYDTSSSALRARLGGDASWSVPDGTSEPPPDATYTLTLPSGTRYRLAALHVTTKELDHWSWTTLWWSDDPNTDFGADRPGAIGAPWSNYKMCVAVAFDEADPDPAAGFEGTLADALAVVDDDRTWCSNPYVEAGHGNAGTNCLGCHQHAGTAVTSQEVLAADGWGRRQVRESFPADYTFATTRGDDLEQLFADVELYHLDLP